MSIWDYLLAGSMIAVGLIFSALFLIDWIVNEQERKARKRPK